MSEPDVDRELERLLGVTRHGTEPDVSAQVRIQAALRRRIAGTEGAGSPGGALGPKLWLVGTAGVAILFGVIALHGRQAERQEPRPSGVRGPVASAVMVRAVASNEVASGTSPVDRASTEHGTGEPTANAGTRTRHPASSVRAEAPGLPSGFAGGEEVSLIAAMQRALRGGDTTGALSLADEHARRFPSGALIEEREGGRGIARCRLASKSERAALLDAYLGRYAGSAYAPRVRDACTR